MTEINHFLGKYKHILYIYVLSIILFTVSIGITHPTPAIIGLLYILTYIFTIGGLYVCIITCSIKY